MEEKKSLKEWLCFHCAGEHSDCNWCNNGAWYPTPETVKKIRELDKTWEGFY